jgi:aspartyl aminopeptidase
MPPERGGQWQLEKGGHYFTMRGESSVIAFDMPKSEAYSFKIIAAHTDFPSFKIKTAPEMRVCDSYVTLNTEKYGGLIHYSWLDRPLGAAGRLVVRKDGALISVLADTDRDIALIPSLAIHMNKSVNEEASFKLQSDMLPLFGMCGGAGRFDDMLAEAAGVEKEDIAGAEIFLYVRQNQSVWGESGAFISSPRLDNLQGVFCALNGFLQAEENGAQVNVFCAFDHEEVGSMTMQGAASSFMEDTLRRIAQACAVPYAQMLYGSFMLSADNVHALHPNHTQSADPVNRPLLNNGVVIKQSAARKYATDAVSEAVVKAVMEKAGVPYQYYANNSDIAGGSTLGAVATARVGVECADIGLAQLAMHSAYESAGSADTAYMIRACQVFYESAIERLSDTRCRVL